MAIQPITNFRQEMQNTFSKENVITFAKKMAADTAVTTLATALFTSFNPFAGLIIGAVAHPTTTLINWVCKQLHVGENSMIAKTSARVLSTLTGIALGAIIAQAAGFQITVLGACVISLSAFGLYILAGAIGIGLIILSVLAAQAILKTLPRQDGNQTDNQARNTVEHFHATVNDLLHNRIGIERHIQGALTDFHLLIDEIRRKCGLNVENQNQPAPEPVNLPLPTAPQAEPQERER